MPFHTYPLYFEETVNKFRKFLFFVPHCHNTLYVFIFYEILHGMIMEAVLPESRRLKTPMGGSVCNFFGGEALVSLMGESRKKPPGPMRKEPAANFRCGSRHS